MKKFLTSTVITLSLVSLFTDIASEMLYPIMPVFLKSIGFSVLLIGILEGVAEATAGFSKGYFGELSDKMGKRTPFIRWGYLLSALSKPALAISQWPIWIFLARTTDRLGKGIRTSARDALLSDEATPATKGKVFGFHRAMDTLGAAIGPAVALVFLWYFPGQYSLLFLVAFLPGLVAVALTLLIREKAASKTTKPETQKSVSFFSFLEFWKTAPANYRHILIGIIGFTLFNSSDAFLLLKVKESGVSDTYLIGMYISYNLLYALLSYPMGWLADRFGMKKMVVLGISIFAITYFLFAEANRVGVYVALFGLYSLYAAATEGVVKGWVTNNVPKNRTATGLGLLNSLQSIATLLASSIAGAIWAVAGSRILFYVAALGAAASAIFIAICTKSNVAYPENE